MRGRRGQRGGRGRGRVRGQAFPPRKVADQENNNEESRPPTPQPQEGEPLELETEDGSSVPPPAPRTLARLPSMPLQVSLRARKSLQNNSTDSEISKDILNADVPNTPITSETGLDGSSPEEDDRPVKRRRILENGSTNSTAVIVNATSAPPTRGRGRGRGRARGRARGEVGRGRGRGRGRGSRGGPGSRGGRGAYRVRGRGRGGRGGTTKVVAGPVAEVLVEDIKQDKEEVTTNDWYSGVTGSSYRNPSCTTISLLQEKKVKLIAESASLDDLKKRHSELKDRFRNVSKLMMALDYSRANKTLKELKSGRDLVSQAPWAKQIYKTLEDRLQTHMNRLDGEMEFKQINGIQVFQNSCKIVQRSFEISLGEWMDHCVIAFIREKRDISELWKVRDPYLNQWILRRCGVNRTENVTMTDLIETFLTREGRDFCRYDRPQLATRTNEGLFDRKVNETWTARARRVFGDFFRTEKDSLMTPPQSPGLEQNNTSMEIDSNALVANQSIHDLLRENDKLGVGKLNFVFDYEYDRENPAQFLPLRRYTTREAMAVDSLARLKEGIELDSDDEFDKYSDGDCYEADDEVMSVDESNEGTFDRIDFVHRDTRDDDDRESEKWQRLVVANLANLRKQNGAGRGSSKGSEREEVIVPSSRYPAEPKPSRMESSQEEDPISRSPSSGPLTTKRFEFVLTSETPSQSAVPGSAWTTEVKQAQIPISDAGADHPEKTNGHLQDKTTFSSSTPGSGTLSRPTNLSASLKRSRDGSGKEHVDPTSHELPQWKPSDPEKHVVAKLPNHVTDRPDPALSLLSKSKYGDATYPGVSTGARHPFLNDRNFDKPINGTNLTPGNHGQRAMKPFADPSGFTPVLESSFISPNGAPMDKQTFTRVNDVQLPPARGYRSRGLPRKETGKPGRKPNTNTPTPGGYAQPEYPLQGKGRILSPKPAPTTSQMNYSSSGYPPPKFALPSNSAAQAPYLKQYTASTTPSPLRSQSRPPYDPRDGPNPTWAGASYPYTGPSQSPSPYQPPGDYNYDPSRSSAPPQAPYQPAPMGYGPYNVPSSGSIRSTPGTPGNPFQTNNPTPTPYSSQTPYFMPSGYVQAAPPKYPRPYPPNPTWNTPVAQSAPSLPCNSSPGKPYEGKSPQLYTRPPVTPTGSQQGPVKYYVGDGIYKTAPSTIERMPILTPSQGTVFEEDSYSKDLNRLARNGNWGSGTPGSGNNGPAQGSAL